MRRFFFPWLFVTIVVIVLERNGQYALLFQHHSVLGYDKLLHFLGGIACGIFGAWLAVYGPFDPLRSLRSHNALVMTAALVSAFAIGLAWEVLEYVVPTMQDPLGWDLLDTSLDMVYDLLGSAVAARAYQEKARPDA